MFYIDLGLFTNADPSAPHTPTAPVLQVLSDEEILKNPAVQAALAEARKQEKNKMYGRVNSLETDFDNVKKQLADAQKLKDEQATEAERQRVAALSAEERITHQANTFEQRMQQAARDAENKIRAAEEKAHKAYLRSHRNDLLRQHGIIEDLADFVTGNSEEELDASAQLVKTKQEKLKPTTPPVVHQQVVTHPPPGAGPNGIPTNTNQDLTEEQLANVSTEEYNKNPGFYRALAQKFK